MDWQEVRELLLRVFRNSPLRVTVHLLDERSGSAHSSDPDQGSTLPACGEEDQVQGQAESKTGSGESCGDTKIRRDMTEADPDYEETIENLSQPTQIIVSSSLPDELIVGQPSAMASESQEPDESGTLSRNEPTQN